MRTSILPRTDMANFATLRPVTVDDMSSVRYVHSTAFRILAAEYHSEEEIKSFTDLIYSRDYVDGILSNSIYVALVDEEIVGTAGWTPADDNGSTARIRKVYVRPLFTNCGIGKMLVKNAESRAKTAGFTDFSVRANINAIPFYEHLGYEITSYGVMPTPSDIDLPVAFMRKYSDIHRMPSSRRSIPVAENGWWSQQPEH
jgi:putative acetyltransferase